MTLTYSRSKIPTCMLHNKHQRPKFLSVSIYDEPCLSYHPIFRKVHRVTPTWPWTLKGQRYLIYVQVTSTWVPNFNLFFSAASCFWATGHFETSAPNDPQMTLNTERSKVPHIHVTTNPKSQISLVFALHAASLFQVTGQVLVLNHNFSYFFSPTIWFTFSMPFALKIRPPRNPKKIMKLFLPWCSQYWPPNPRYRGPRCSSRLWLQVTLG